MQNRRRCWRSETIVLAAVLMMAGAAVFFSGYRIHKTLFEYRRGWVSYQKVKEIAKIPESENMVSTKFEPDLAALKTVNPDCVGYLYCEGVLSYPIVKGSDNQYYLTHLFDGTENAAGAIFMDAAGNGFADRNCILYGHNMLDHSMFGGLYRYEDENFYKEHPVMDVYTEEGHVRYYVLAAYRSSVDGIAYKTKFSEAEDFQAFLKEIKRNGTYETVYPDWQNAEATMTLSTCTWDSSQTERFVVVCVREKGSKKKEVICDQSNHTEGLYESAE